MAKNRGSGGSGGGQPTPSGGGGLDLNKIGNKLLNFVGLGGWPPAGTDGSKGGSWIPLGESATGGNAQQNGIFWGGSGGLLMTFGSPLSSILMESPRVALGQNAAPTLQRLHMQALDGQVDIGAAYVSAGFPENATFEAVVGLGLYVAELVPGSPNLYQVQDPCSALDASRWSWLYLECRRFMYTPLMTPSTVPISNTPNVLAMPKVFDLTNPAFGVKIVSGEALMMTINVVQGANVPTGQQIPPNCQFNFQPTLRAFLSSLT